MSEDCQHLRNFLSGNQEVEYFSDIGIESLREHWHDCEECGALLPDAISLIDSRAKAYLSRIVDNLRLLHGQFKYAELQVLHPPVADSLKPLNFRPEDLQPKIVKFEVVNAASTPPGGQPHTELLKLLAQAGDTTREQLQFLNENWGLCTFCVARGDACEYYSEICGPLISSLPQDVQLFIFRAMLASEILNLLPEEFPADVGSTLYRTVENAGPEFLRKYLQQQEQTIHSKSAVLLVPGERQGPSDTGKILETVVAIKDDVERLKDLAVDQIERLQKSEKERVTVDEDELRELYGRDLYPMLSPETQGFIRKGELHFRNPQVDDYYPAIKFFHRAYDCEFRGRISAKLVRSLANLRYREYRSPRYELMKEGRFNGELSLGQQLSFLRDDNCIREMLLALGLKVDEIYQTADGLNKERNAAEHPPEGTQGNPRRDAERVRDMLRGSRSILMLLFPTGKA